MSAAIEIRAPGAAPIRREVGAETWIIGRKPRAGVPGIAVPTATDLADEHLIVSFVRDRFHVALAAGAKLEPALGGRSFRQAEVAFGDEVKLGSTSLRFSGSVKRNAPSPILIAAAVLVLGFSAWALLDDTSNGGVSRAAPSAPALFGAPDKCPYAGPQAQGRASEAEQAAMAHTERYAFDAYEGIQAVYSYQTAAACYTAGGDTNSAARAAAAAKAWQGKLESRYQAHQLRLRLALDRGRLDRALREVKSLTQLLRGSNSPYMSWLHAQERNLAMR